MDSFTKLAKYFQLSENGGSRLLESGSKIGSRPTGTRSLFEEGGVGAARDGHG
jgi:hypothetical protein